MSLKSEMKFHSQFGEDRLLANIFQEKTKGVCIEVGANDGINDSNTYYFENSGWNCVLVEPNPYLCQLIRSSRTAILHECAASNASGSTILNIAEGSERSHGVSTICGDQEAIKKIQSYGFTTKPIEVNTRTLDSILVESKIIEPIDFITIDVEGHELAVLQGLSLQRWSPTIIIIEDNSYFTDNSISTYLEKFNYVKFNRTGVNDWYAQIGNRRLVNIKSKSRYLFQKLTFKTLHLIIRIPGIRILKQYLQKCFN